jgi:hypothetical protein
VALGWIGVLLASAVVAVPPPRVSPRSETTQGDRGPGMNLQRTADGGYRYRDAAQGFEATIGPDGRVEFRDLPLRRVDPEISILGINPFTLRAKPPPEKPPRDDIVPHGPYGPPPILLGVGGRMGGIADVAVKKQRTAAKRRFMEQTAALRDRLARSFLKHQSEVALFDLGRQLLDVFKDESLPLSVRKERLFQRWDACEEGDPAVAQYGERARRKIERFIRQQAPERGPDAFTPAELRDMNARRQSRQPFAPYDARPAPDRASDERQ